MKTTFGKIKEAITKGFVVALLGTAMVMAYGFWVLVIIKALFDPCGGSVGC